MKIINKTHYRVRYGDTDKMEVVYYGNYPFLYEIGRTEMMRDIGLTYKEMEEEGIMMPVIDMQIKYHAPAYYDELLTIQTELNKAPGVKIEFIYKIYNEKEELLNEAMTTLAFVNIASRRPLKAPAFFLEKLNASATS